MLKQLQAIVGAEHVSDDPDVCDLATSDIFEWPGRKSALLVVSPRTTDETSAILRVLRASHIPVIARGAGLSYTGAFAMPQAPIVVDTSRMNNISVNAPDRCATVGAGASWASVADALKPFGMKSAQASPISGTYSTVGGLAAQGMPAGLDGILGLTVVLSDGSVVRTGAPTRFYRYAGPDLTGLFLGDCGAFGIKTEIVIRIAPEQPTAFASFGFDNADDLLQGMITCLSEGVVTRAFAMDPVKSRDTTKVEAGAALSTAAAVIQRSGSLIQSVKDTAKLLRQAVAPASDKSWSLHLTVESPTQVGTDAQLQRAREICRSKGVEGDDLLPRALKAKPYSVRGFVGPSGERWVPVHGIFSLSQTRPAMAALQDSIASQSEQMTELSVAVSWLLSSSGTHVTIEPMLYWRDRLDPIHMRHLSLRNRERFNGFAANPAARQFVRAMRERLRDVMDAHGAVHSQLGRFYRTGNLDADALLARLKATLDPDHRINPGVLGIPGAAEING
jgi:FAD/FMN-containing dehydrogenase